ncbi:IS1634 family transposase [Streptomyces sp. NPDC005065]|uniref:IS1634 family transposase n=1 Tax=Streptomyces sp. NPDC005065 TaxID=3154461 RepID=UPI0033B4E281
MPSIISKRRGAKTYYYLVESARVDGKPRIVSQQYLGSGDEVAAKLAGESAGAPVRSQHKEFGALAAVWSVLERLGVRDAVDRAAPRRADAAATAGTYIALATANRVVAPCSKAAFAIWWESTAGPRFTKVPVAAVDHRRFWKAMELLGETQLADIEAELGQRMVSEFDLDLTGLILDMANFATFIDSANDKAPLAQRGKAKQKRVDLRLIGLAMVVTRDGGVPVLSRAYPGDRPDVTQFTGVIDELLDRYRALTTAVESLTVVYDAGQNSSANHERVEEAGIGFVGSLPPSDHQALLALPASRFKPVDEDVYPGVTCVDTTVTALGVTRRAVLTHSPTLHAAQHRGFDQTLAKARNRLTALQARLARGRTRKAREAVEAEITAILHPRWVGEVITTTLTGTLPADLRLSWRTDQTARRRLEKRVFGKRILFTNRDTWTTAEVVAAYRSQSEVESGFRQLKDTHVVSFSPMHHWTDSKIRVHVFYCVLALTVAHLMRREAARAGLNLSVRELIAQLAGIQETVLLHHDGGKGRPRAQRMLTDMNDTQRQLAELFTISRYAPTR